MGSMGPTALVHAMTIGGALLALWVYVRFAKRGPRSARRVCVHLVLAGVALVLAPYAVREIAGEGPAFATAAALFGAFLPAMTYTFLAALFLIEHVQRAIYAR